MDFKTKEEYESFVKNNYLDPNMVIDKKIDDNPKEDNLEVKLLDGDNRLQ